MRILHTMLRVGDLQRSIDFYTQMLKMQLIRKMENPEYHYSLAFLGYGPEAQHTVLELTYNWGVSEYTQGNAFGHIAFAVEDIVQACTAIKTAGGTVTREPGPVKGGSTVIAFIKDPDGYQIELIQEEKN